MQRNDDLFNFPMNEDSDVGADFADQFLNFDDESQPDLAPSLDIKKRQHDENSEATGNTVSKKFKSEVPEESVTQQFKVTEFSKKQQQAHTFFFRVTDETKQGSDVALFAEGSNEFKNYKLTRSFFCSPSTKLYGENENKFHDVSANLSVALAVISGKFMRLILGKSHARSFLATSTTDDLTYRMSQEVPGISTSNYKERVLGAILMPLLTYAVRDDDHEPSNLLTVAAGKNKIFVKIDPECSFAGDITESETEIAAHIQYLFEPKINPFAEKEKERQAQIAKEEAELQRLENSAKANGEEDDSDDYESEGSESDNSSEDEQEQWDRLIADLPQFFNKIFIYSLYRDDPDFAEVFNDDNARKTELFVGLYLFLRHDVERYLHIIDKVLDTVTGFEELSAEERHGFESLADYKAQFKANWDKRYEAIKKTAQNLPGYKEFVANAAYLESEVYQAYCVAAEQAKQLEIPTIGIKP